MNFQRAAETALAYAGKHKGHLATHWGVTRQTVMNRLTSDNPRYLDMKSVAEFCGVTMDDFLKWGE